MEDVEVIVATIAFGMGIDKPDVRFVIHHDIPKSMEGYYQETGRAGRDGGEGVCIAFYTQKDVDKLAKFMKDKPVSEREIGTQILKEVIDYAESGVCRRKQILHYFGENFNETGCNCMCDNCKKPKKLFEAEESLVVLLKLIQKIGEKFDDAHILNVILGLETAQTIAYEHSKTPEFGLGVVEGENYWKSLVRQAVLNNFLSKDIDNYSLKCVLNEPIESAADDDEDDVKHGSGTLDTQLLQLLKDLRKKIAKQKNVPPFVVFQDPSLEEMCTHYPIAMDELKQISGVGNGKAFKFGGPFLELIKKYVDDNDIERPIDLIIKTQANKSQLKVSIIQNIDRKIGLEDIAKSKGITYDDILKEIEAIVNSGTKLNLNYFVDELIEEERPDVFFDFFQSAESDSIEEALKELGETDYSREEIQLMRIKFMSELGN
jgi:ATP-dependent DNA helicase RecQ